MGVGRAVRTRAWRVCTLAAFLLAAGPGRAPAVCVGDCKGVGKVDIADLILGVNIVLGTAPVTACPAFQNLQGLVDIAQLIQGVDNALNGCGGLAITLTGSCVAPGSGNHGLKPCDVGTPIAVFRCDNPKTCLHGQALTMLGSTTVASGGAWSVDVLTDPNAALVFQASITNAVVYRTLSFGTVGGSSLRARLGGALTFAPADISPVTEAAVELLDSNGFENYSDAGANMVFLAVEQATADLSFADFTPEGATMHALQTAMNNQNVMMVLQTARNTPTPSATPTPTNTPPQQGNGFAIQLVGAGPRGTDPVPGVRVLRNNPTTGAVVGDTLTDADGRVDFGNVGPRTTVSYVITQTDPEPRKGVFTLVNIPTAPFGSANPLVLNVFSSDVGPERPTLVTVNVTAIDLPSGTNQVQLFTGDFESEGSGTNGSAAEFPGFPVDQLQSDGKISLLAAAQDSTGVIRGCGSAVDLDPAAVNNANMQIEAAISPTIVSFTAAEPVEPGDIDILRKSVIFELTDLVATQQPGLAGGLLALCPLPDAEAYRIAVGKRETPSQSSNELDLVFPALPRSFEAPLPNVSIDSLDRSSDGTMVTWTRSGGDLGTLDFATALLEWTSGGSLHRWQLASDPSVTSFTLPTLPGNLSDFVPPASGVGVRVQLGGLDNVEGVVDLLEKISTVSGDFDRLSFEGTTSFFVDRSLPVLAVSKDGSGSGTVFSKPDGIDCGNLCAANFAAGSDVTLVAVPAPGSTFAFWSGDGCGGNGGQIDVTMDSSHFCTATFDAQ